ncbi:hypothetical protein IYR97_13485 [Pseudomonas fulva]|uniref:Uncharacterized protein n=2 Tax=Gammaproteobacteria TaxID=1236 RepID=A0A7S9L4I3_9PSED|nr:hypothetical protein [Pseudomonas fulva]QPH42346.1 hypothetical protein IYR97_13485 [Pseudomonas fulva]QPH47410.1 hypothetical protein IZU98_13380 [Pseudomonas fulva]
MAYNSAHTGPEIDAAVQLLGQIQDARDGTSQDLIKVKGLSSQVKADAIQVSADAQTVAEKAAQVASSSAAVEQARVQVVSATVAAEEAMGEAALSANSAQESQAAASVSEHAAAQSQLAAGLSEQVSAEHAAEATQAANQVSADRMAAQSSAESAATSARNAEAVVTGGTASVTPNPGLIPLADSAGKIDADWLPESIARAGEVQAAAAAAAEAVDTAAEAQSRTERFLLPSPEAPVVRDDDSPLQVGDRYFNAVDQVEFIYTNYGWQANDSLQAIAELRGEITETPIALGIPRADSSGKINPDWLGGFFYDYSELRAYQGNSSRIVVTRPGLYGEFRSLGVIPGFIDTDGTYIITVTGVVYERIHDGRINVHWFNCPLDGVTDGTAAFAKWTSQLKIGRALIPPGKYVVSEINFKTVGQSPTIGGLEVEATGATIVSECAVRADSCKRLTITGLEGFSTDLHLNGAWFAQMKDLKMRLLICGSAQGTVFSDNYWNTFIGGQFQAVMTHQNSTAPSNKFDFINVALRGNASQGYVQAQDYAFRFMANQNVQSWTWQGGDISYHTVDILYADVSNTADIEMLFDDTYLDSKYVRLKSRPKTRIRTDSHAANEMPNVAAISEVARGASNGYRSDRAAGWKSDTGYNMIPNGDFYDVLPSYVGAGLPIGSANSAVITPKTGASFSGGIRGNYININQALTASNSVRIRPKALPTTARCSCVLVARNAAPGSKTLRVSFSGLFFSATLTDNDWSTVNITTGADIPAGTVSDIQIYTEDGTAFNVDVCYAGVFVGETPMLFLPADRHQKLYGSVAWNPPSVAAGQQSPAQLVLVPGVNVGDFADASFTLPLGGAALKASVSAQDTVEVFLKNDTAASIDLGAGTLRVRVEKASY